MENSFKRYGGGRGCVYFDEQFVDGMFLRYWCKRMYCYLTDEHEICDECRRKIDIPGAIQRKLDFGENDGV